MRALQPNRVQQYIKNFSDVADIVDVNRRDSNELPIMHHVVSSVKEKVEINAMKFAIAKSLT